VRFLLYDRFVDVVPGQRVRTVKHVSLTEEYFRAHYPHAPLVPPAFVLESMLQSLGGLVMVTHGYAVLPVLSLVEDVTLPPALGPGCRLDVQGELLSTNPAGSLGRASVEVEGRTVASAGRILYAHVPVKDAAALKDRFRRLGAVP
jgi:3-hydroxyacyl-[acyl-carrier-protein] dehydratase